MHPLVGDFMITIHAADIRFKKMKACINKDV